MHIIYKEWSHTDNHRIYYLKIYIDTDRLHRNVALFIIDSQRTPLWWHSMGLVEDTVGAHLRLDHQVNEGGHHLQWDQCAVQPTVNMTQAPMEVLYT